MVIALLVEHYEKGCRAVIVEEDVENLPQDMTVYKVSESREALTVIAGNFYEHPSKKLNMIGVTGTNGKNKYNIFYGIYFKYNRT